MKKLMVIALTLALAASAGEVSAQAVTREQKKEQKALSKELKAKADKDSRKEAKALAKDGWRVMPGKLPLEKQIQEAKYSELMDNDEGTGRRFLTATHQSMGGNYSAAKQIADDRARVELAQAIYNDVSGKIKSNLGSTNFGKGDVAAIDEFVSANQSVISAQLKGVEQIIEIYRETGQGVFEVRVFVRIDAEKALRDSQNSYYNLLYKRSEKLASEFNQILEE